MLTPTGVQSCQHIPILAAVPAPKPHPFERVLDLNRIRLIAVC